MGDYSLPSTMVNFNKFSKYDQESLVRAYNAAMLDNNDAKFPQIRFPVRSKRSKKGFGGVSGSSTERMLRGSSDKIKPVFTEGISSKSSKDEPVFYLHNQLVAASNQPGGVQYIRDKSKLIFQPATTAPAVNTSYSNKQQKSSTRHSHPWEFDFDLTPRGAVKVTRNNTMLLPKIFMERELPLTELSLLRHNKNQRKQSPRQRLMMQYVKYQDNVKDNIPLSVITDSLSNDVPNKDVNSNTVHYEEIDNKPNTPFTQVPNNSPMKSASELFQSDSQFLAKQKSFVSESNQSAYNIVLESDDVINIDGHVTDRSQVNTYSRISEVPKVLLGEEEDLNYYRHFQPKTTRSVADLSTDGYTTRPSTMESRYALSTPGRKLKPYTTINSYNYDKTFPSKEQNIGHFDTMEQPIHKGVVIAEEGNQIHNYTNEGNIKTKNAAVKMDDKSNRSVAANSIKRITIGDPHKDSNFQDKKLNNSKLEDLYKRGIVQKQSSNRAGYIPRSPVKKMYDRLYSRASGVSTTLGNPPPSAITDVVSTPPIKLDMRQMISEAMASNNGDDDRCSSTQHQIIPSTDMGASVAEW